MIIFFLIGICVIAIGLDFIYQRNWDKDLNAKIAFERSVVYAGEQTNLFEIIENKKRMPVLVLEVAFHLRRELVFHQVENTSVSDFSYKRDVFALLGQQRITRTLPIDCTKRGFYQINQIDMSAFSLFFHKKYIGMQEADVCICVYAKRTDVSKILLTCERMIGSIQCAKRLYEDPFAFSSIRDYTLNDPMKSINWKASAKTGSLMVNTFDSTMTGKVMVYLDLEDSEITKYEKAVEEGISIAATLSQKFLAKGMEVGISVNVAGSTNLRLEPSAGNLQLAKIEKLLAERKLTEQIIPLREILNQPPENSILLVISKNAFRNQKDIETFLAQNNGMWVFPYEKGANAEIEVQRGIQFLKREVEN